MSEQLWWYVARASGMVAAVLLVMTLIWGLLLTTKLIDRRGLPAWLTDLHRYLGGLSVVFIAVHMLSLVFDNYMTFSWSELFVPFASSWKAGPVAWGVGAFWALVVVEGTSMLQRRMNRTWWRGLHYLSYPVALMTALHAAQAGTDAANPVFRVVTIGLVAVLSALTVFRILYSPPKRSVVRTTPRGATPATASTPGGAASSGPASNRETALR